MSFTVRRLEITMFFFLSFLFGHTLFAGAPSVMTFQSKILTPSGTALEAASVNFRFTVLDAAGTCVLYVEDYSNVNMTGSQGVAAIPLGSGTKVYPPAAVSLYEVFNNATASFNCQAGGTVSPTATDNRQVVMQFNDGSGWQTLPQMAINAVPFANYATRAESLGAYAATAYLRPSTLPTCTGTQALSWDGSTFTCISAGGGGGSTFTGVTSITNASGDITLAPAAGTGSIRITSNTPSTSTTTGAVVITGGMGVSGAINAAGNISTSGSVSSTSMLSTTSVFTPQLYGTSTASGSIKIDGTSNATKGDVLLASQGGNVGIGTTSPSYKLHINGSATKADSTVAINTFPVIYLPTQGMGAGQFDGSIAFGDGLRNLVNAVDPEGRYNTAVGLGALLANTTGNVNTAVGNDSLKVNTTGSLNTGIGAAALNSNTSGSRNTAVGTESLFGNTTGTSNTGIGVMALNANTTGIRNTVMGDSAFPVSTTGNNNTGVGVAAAANLTTGSQNTAMGDSALAYDTSGNANVAIGYAAALGSGGANKGIMSNSVFVGASAGYNIRASSQNTVIGASAGNTLSTGSNNILIGYNVQTTAATSSNQLNIGNLIYGDLSGKYLGVGTSSPTYALSVSGDINVTGNFRVNGTVFTGGGGSTLTGVTNISNTSGDITMAPAVGTGAVQINSGAASTSPTTGALIVSGGIGVSGGIYTGGAISSGSTVSANTSMYTPQLYGTSTPSGNILIDGTSNAVKGNVILANAGGKVGVGTTTPTAKFDVIDSSIGIGVQSTVSGTGIANYAFSGLANGASSGVNAGGVFSATGSAAGNQAIRIPSGFPASGPNNFSIFSQTDAKSYFGGPIGIGTSTPGALLDASYSDSAIYNEIGTTSTMPFIPGTSAVLSVRNTSGTNYSASYLHMAAKNGSNTFQNAYIGANAWPGVYSPAIVFGHQTGANAYNERMRISYQGYLGVGTNAPTQKLDVNGAMILRGTSTPALSPAGQGTIYFDSTANVFKVSQNGGAYTNLAAGGDFKADGTVPMTSQLVAATGTPAVPGIAFSGDLTTGFYRPSANTIGIATNGTQKVLIGASGDISLNAGAFVRADAGGGFFENLIGLNSAQDQVQIANNGMTDTWTIGSTDSSQTGRIYTSGTYGTKTFSVDLNGSNRFFVGATGHVGIGTTSPAYALAVSGDINVTGNFRVNGVALGGAGGSSLTGVSSISNSSGDITLAAANTTGSVLVNSGKDSTSSTTGALVVTGGIGVSGGIFTGGAINSGSTISATTSMYSPQLYGTSTASGNIKIDGTSNLTKGNVLLSSAGGNVGVGTTSPTGKLHVEGANTAYTFYAKGNGQNVAYIEGSGASSYATFVVSNTSNRDAASFYGDANKTSGNMIDISTGNANFTGTALAMDMGVYSSGNFTGKFLDFKNSGGTGGVGGPTKFSVDSNGGVYSAGHVGIGTAIDPNYTVAVASNSASGVVADFDDNSGGRNSGAILTVDSDSVDHAGYNLLSITNQNTTSSKFVVRGDGNVGIGTTTPSAKLYVSGAIRATASITSAYTSDTDLNIDFSASNIVTTSASCGSVTLSGMQDGGSYTLIVTGTSSGVCTFSHAGVTSFKFSPVNGATDTSSNGETVYTLLKVGAKVYVSWITGMR